MLRVGRLWLGGALVLLVSACLPPSTVDVGALSNSPNSDMRALNHAALTPFHGELSVLVFGFTACPDVCPTVVQHWQSVLSEWDARGGEPVQFLFVTVDPQRDTATGLATYLSYFDPSFSGIRLEPVALHALLREFKTFARKVPGRTEGVYTLDHSANAFVISPSGRLVDEFPAHLSRDGTLSRLSDVLEGLQRANRE